MPLGQGTRPVAGYKGQGEWQPSNPEAATEDRELGDELKGPQDGTRHEEWVLAPETSHLWGMRFLPAKQSRILGQTQATILVRFRSGTRPATEYAYYFGNDSRRASEVFEEMTAAASPGEVLHERLVRGGVTYRRMR